MTILMQNHPSVKAGPFGVRALPDAPPDTAGFARMPHGLMRDGRLSANARLTACALEFFARTDAVCWPSNARLGEYVGTHAGTVHRALDELEALGYVRRETVRPHRANMTGRTITLLWNGAPSASKTPPQPIAGTIGGDSASAKPSPSEQSGRDERQRYTPLSASAKPGLAPALHNEEGNCVPEEKKKDVTLRDATVSSHGGKAARSLTEAIRALPTEPDLAPTVAQWIATDLDDHKSIAAFKNKVSMVAKGIVPPQRLLDALSAGVGAKQGGGIQRPGAFFTTAWKDWQPRATEQQTRDKDKQETERKRYMEWPVHSLLAYVANQYHQTYDIGPDDKIRKLPSPCAEPVLGVLLECMQARTPEIRKHLKAVAEHRRAEDEKRESQRLANLARLAAQRAGAPIGGARA